MLAVLIMVLLCVPLLELFVIIKVSDFVGAWETIGLIVLVSVVGAWMVRWSGLSVLRQMRARLEQGELPTNELVDGVLILVAGALMLTPGFLTDSVGLLLLLPPTRILVRTMLIQRFRAKMNITGFSSRSEWSSG